MIVLVLSSKYQGVHVLAGQRDKIKARPNRYQGRKVNYFDSIEQAFNASDDYENCIVFIHSGHYKFDYLVIDSNISFIGAGRNNVLMK